MDGIPVSQARILRTKVFTKLVRSVLLLHLLVPAGKDPSLQPIPGAGRHGDHVAVLVDVLEVVAAQEVGDCGELWAVPSNVVVELL